MLSNDRAPRLALLLCALSAAATAGVIHGIILEHASGLALARTRVRLEVLGGTSLEHVRAALTTRSGQFVFHSLPEGYYLLFAARNGFAQAMYGQKQSNSPGMPIRVSADSVTFIELRLKRLGAINGKVLDENRVGLPGLIVLAYPVALPLRMAASAKSDDRGIYRIAGLARGRYYVRMAAHELEDGTGLLPTFAPESSGAGEASIHVVDLDTEVPDVSVYPLPGRLSRLSGRVTGCPTTATVTLSSDTGRKQTTVGCGGGIFSFEALPPGNYELLAEAGEGELALAAHQELFIDRTEEGLNLGVRPLPWVRLEVRERDGGIVRAGEVPILARRKDLAGEGEVTRISKDTVRLLPGYWELTALPAPNRYQVSISSMTGPRRASKAGQSPEWYEIHLGAAERTWVRVVLSSRPATLAGCVTARGDAMAGAPVYLWPSSPETRRRMNGMKMGRADSRGMYRFEGLGPGSYLLLSSFDLGEVTEQVLTEARAASIMLDEGQAGVRDLTLYEAP